MLFYASLCFYFFNYPCRLCCNVFSPSYSVCIFFFQFWLIAFKLLHGFFFNLSFLTWLVLVLLPDIISCFLNDCLPYFYCLHLWFFAFSCIFSTTYVLSLKKICVHHHLFPFDFVRICCATRWSSTQTDVNVQLFFWNSFSKCKSFVSLFVFWLFILFSFSKLHLGHPFWTMTEIVLEGTQMAYVAVEFERLLSRYRVKKLLFFLLVLIIYVLQLPEVEPIIFATHFTLRENMVTSAKAP